MKKLKIIVIINTIAIFFGMFLFHFGYTLMPNFLTASLFPVNESLYEHLKLIYVTEMLVGFIVYLVLFIKKIKVNNYFLGLLVSTLVNIGLFFLIFLPLYNRFGENIVMTMGIFLVTLIITEYLFYLIMKKDDLEILNFISIIIIPFIWVILFYFTLNPMHNDFFFDTKEEKYGLNEYLNP